MNESLYVTADWSRFVEEGSPEAAFGVAPVDIDRLGLREAYERFVTPEPKEAPKPADKSAKRPATK
jgi:hypothetical protein